MRRFIAAAAILITVIVAGRPASAHPLGNLTVNTYAGIVVHPDHITIDAVLDLAELPTVPERAAITSDPVGYAARRCGELADGLTMTVDGNVAPLRVESSRSELRAGQAGLDTARIECAIRTDATGRLMTMRDTNFGDRIGWREITITGDTMTVTSSAPSVSVSERLQNYPSEVRPLRVLEVTAVIARGGAAEITAASPDGFSTQVRGTDRLTRTINGLIDDRQLSVGVGLLCGLIAFALGALHALAPGHGKTMMAAYVVGRRANRLRRILELGLTVAVTHTLGVVVLGTVIWTSQAVAPDRILPWLTVASGLLVAATGVVLLVRRGLLGRSHSHHHITLPAESDGRGWTIMMGLAGGLVPTPSALVVLLGSTAIGRPWFGVVLVGIYGIGMAAVLAAAGLLLVRLQALVERYWYGRGSIGSALRWLPVATATVLVAGGTTIVMRGAAGL